MSFSRIRCDLPDHGRTKSPAPQDAYVVQMMMRDLDDAQLWLGGRETPVRPIKKGGLFLFHMESDPVASYHSAFDNVRIHISKATLDELAADLGRRRPEGLKRPEFAAPDPILYHLAACVAPLIEQGAAANQLILDHLALAVHAHLLAAYAGSPLDGRTSLGGLAPWQERRAKDFIEANLGRDPSLAEIADQCGLSVSHFSRAFRNATGRPPHRWLLERRVELAKDKLGQQSETLAEIAVACGFSDPSHFSRVFSKATGVAPGAWRRMRKA